MLFCLSLSGRITQISNILCASASLREKSTDEFRGNRSIREGTAKDGCLSVPTVRRYFRRCGWRMFGGVPRAIPLGIPVASTERVDHSRREISKNYFSRPFRVDQKGREMVKCLRSRPNGGLHVCRQKRIS